MDIDEEPLATAVAESNKTELNEQYSHDELVTLMKDLRAMIQHQNVIIANQQRQIEEQ